MKSFKVMILTAGVCLSATSMATPAGEENCKAVYHKLLDEKTPNCEKARGFFTQLIRAGVEKTGQSQKVLLAQQCQNPELWTPDVDKTVSEICKLFRGEK